MNDGNGGERVGRGEEESGADLGGGKREAQGPRGERGEWERGPRRRGCWRPYPPRRRRGGAAGTAPVPTPVGGTGKGGEWERWAGPGVGPVGPGVLWGGGLLLFPFLCLCSFAFSFYLFIFFSVLFHLKYLGIL